MNVMKVKKMEEIDRYVVTVEDDEPLDFETKEEIATAIATEKGYPNRIAFWDGGDGEHSPELTHEDSADWWDKERDAFDKYVNENAEICVEVEDVEFYFA